MSSCRDTIKNAVSRALEAMRNSGFEISEKPEVVIDPELPFMGYATKKSGKNVIVVSGNAIKSGPVEGLLIHEMCHIYRTEQNHPSHNSKLLDSIGHAVIHGNHLTEDYQIRTIQQAVNHIQDLYADDIAFKIFEKNGSFTPEQAFEFFLDWIQDAATTPKIKRDKWLNIGVTLNNCFAISNLTRHKIKDIDNQVENKIQKFLIQVNPHTKKEFTYFRNFMINLEENPAETQFKKDLTEYLTRTIKLAE